MHAALLGVVHPDNTPHGANLTFAVPVLVFVIVSAALFIRFRAPHTVPGHVAFRSSRWVTASRAGKAEFGADAVDAAVGAHAEPDKTVAAEAADPERTAQGTVQSGTAAQATETPAGDAAAPEQVKPADEGTEDGE
ncbi:MAG: hypothetical protein ACR2FU_23805 [Streptosporangiaceae bacterium]